MPAMARSCTASVSSVISAALWMGVIRRRIANWTSSASRLVSLDCALRITQSSHSRQLRLVQPQLAPQLGEFDSLFGIEPRLVMLKLSQQRFDLRAAAWR